jgi:hypothetical protein
MNEFKNNTVKEKNLKGNKSTGHSNKTPKTQSERFLAL